MRVRLMKLGAALAALAALAVGGAALASAGGGSHPTKAPAVVQKHQAKSGTATKEPAEKADTDSVQDTNGADNGSEATDPGESGSEVAGNDGPGGWADEPANPNADTQQQGEN